ncbi:MAG: hypothetical protein HDR88_06705 [Bacteroides sp.]|nr:hypothetical protein [Bacteroides sp.]
MKKIFSILMALCLMVPAMYADHPQSSINKQLLKAQQKEAKAKMKEYKKGGYEMMGSRSMEVALMKHYTRLEELGNDGIVFDGIASRTKSKSLGEQMALNDATLKYAQKAGSTVKGRVLADMRTEGVTGDDEFEKFYAAYERLVEQKVKDALVPSYSVVKTNSDGTFEIQSFFIVDESIAKKMRQAALENALKDSELMGKYADQVRGYVNARVEE